MAGFWSRREWIKAGMAVGAGTALARPGVAEERSGAASAVRVGFVGVGNRGTSLLQTSLGLPNPSIEVPAVCDIDVDAAKRAERTLVSSGRSKPELYTDGERAYEKMMARDDLDAVLIATPWHWHTPMAVCAMQHGHYAGVEVPAAISIDECWQLVNTSEETGKPCMMLENWSFRFDNLALLRMVRAGLFGEIVHCHCAHSHDCIDHWFFDRETGVDKWQTEYLVRFNRDQYPTHSLGPVLSWMDINCGDRFDTMTSSATDSFGINAYMKRRFGPDHPSAQRKFAQGDIVTTTIRTKKGKTIVVNYDMQLPRPYDNRWMLQGTSGIYNEQRDAVYLVDRSPDYHEWEPAGPYFEQYRHPWWKEGFGTDGHGGTDALELFHFLDAVGRKVPVPLDVYDSVVMSSVVALSGMSIEAGGAPVKCPDFTRGRWETASPRFAVV